ncbi:KGGVGR-motif variant AAA ATPase [Mucilaginibacter sp. E4BP6]|uniref:KGGVGR-motif variant AAA ATPase n=1 Tax=Mucilaginibacter sp. E4BP6 TaxID=2723089 RepID=UPI0015C9850E|nr:GH25 family lysozyme [Mucilaginibacter sp. E4BP6]NYE64881.1 GH25 family lysozyme M1 (1,4-beta-N-acetylmuramidase)/cellulose biosynthesis protein BcsQ [Mucilaginibacter sp. E4BP6]
MKKRTEEIGRIVTFYSYKGGVGRSMALANIAVLLANWGYKTLIIDWDLEAPGLENFYKQYINIPAAKRKKGLIDLLKDEMDGAENKVQWKDCLIKIDINANKKGVNFKDKLHLITSGNYNNDYNERVRSFDFGKFYSEHDGGNVIEKFRYEWKAAYDFVLIDSRTGVTDIGGVCTIQLPDMLVLLFTPTDQGFDGIRSIADKASAGRKVLPDTRIQLDCLPVPTRIDATEKVVSENWFTKFEDGLKELYAPWLSKDVDRADFLLSTKVPYSSFYSFGEGLPVVEEGTKDPQKMGYAYEPLAALVAKQLQHAGLLLTNRDDFIQSAVTELDVDTLDTKQAYREAQETLRNREQKLSDTLVEVELIKKTQQQKFWKYLSAVVITLIIAIICGSYFYLRKSTAVLAVDHSKEQITDSLINVQKKIDSLGSVDSTALTIALPARFDSIAKAGKPIGIDLSRKNLVNDWGRVRSAGISFVFLKATDGVDYVDATFNANWLAAKDNRMIRGAYLYYSTHSSAGAQAEAFIANVRLDSGDLPPVLDLNELSGMTAGSTLNNTFLRIDTILRKLSLHYKTSPIIFCTYDVAKLLSYSRNVTMYDLWLGTYGQNNKNTYTSVLTKPHLPGAWTKWTFWQFTTEGTIDGITNNGANVDLNQFNGSYRDLKTLTLP